MGDRGLDRERIISNCIENDLSFIFRGNQRHLLYKHAMISYYEIATETKLIHTVQSKGRTFKANVAEVEFKIPNLGKPEPNR